MARDEPATLIMDQVFVVSDKTRSEPGTRRKRVFLLRSDSSQDMGMSAPRLVILDKSFLQAESRNCRRLHALRHCGCTFVLTDTLVYELCTGSRDTLWSEAQRKLWEFADAIEVWRHTGELLKDELATKKPVGHPLDEDLTDQTRFWFGGRTEYVPDDLRSRAETARQQREVESVEALIRLCRIFCKMYDKPYAEIRTNLAQGKDLRAQMNDLVNEEQMVKLWIQMTHGNPKTGDIYIKGAEKGLSPDWFAYHHARSSLALWCVFMLKYGENDQPGKEFRNTKLDSDYAAVLYYADAIATNETSGSMADMCSWLYRGSKKLFSTSQLDAFLPSESKVQLDAYFSWHRRGRKNGHDLEDWLAAERAQMVQVWDRLWPESDSSNTAI